MGERKKGLSVLDSLGILSGRNADTGLGLLGNLFIATCEQDASHPDGQSGGVLGHVGS